MADFSLQTTTLELGLPVLVVNVTCSFNFSVPPDLPKHHLGSIWERCGNDLGMIQNRFGTAFGSRNKHGNGPAGGVREAQTIRRGPKRCHLARHCIQMSGPACSASCSADAPASLDKWLRLAGGRSSSALALRKTKWLPRTHDGV